MPDTIDINIYPVVETVTLNVQPNLTTINVNTVAGGGGTQTLQQVMALGRFYSQVIGDYTYSFGFVGGQFGLSITNNITSINTYQSLTQSENVSAIYDTINNIEAAIVNSLDYGVGCIATNDFGVNFLKIPYRTSGVEGQETLYQVQNNKPAGTYLIAGLDDIANVNTNAIDRITVKLSQSINKGQAVYISGANGTNILVSKASNTTEATSSKTIGLLETTGATNAIVNVVTDGLLTGLNTNSATIGDPVWLGVNGDLIYGLANKPYAPAHLVFIGVVSRVSATVGEILIKVQNGFELKEIHDVDLISNAPTNNQALVYDSATLLWKNKTIIEDSITDAVIDKSPSQNAVFDALGLKTNLTQFNTLRLPIASVGNTTLTGTVTETKVATLLANADVFDSACYIYLTYNFMKSVANAISIKLYVNTSDSLTGATLIGQYLTGSNRNVDFTRKFLLRGTTLDLLTDTTSRITNINTDTVFASSTTVTVAPTSALYFIFSVTLDLVGSVVTNKVAILEKQKL